jgi:hypothetical protein
MCADFETWTSAITNYALMLDLFYFFVARLLVRLVSLDVEILTIFCHCMLCIC